MYEIGDNYKYEYYQFGSMKIKNIPVNLIDIANENVRKDDSFGKDDKDELMKEHLSKFDLLQPVVVRFDNESQRYKLLIGRRRYFALSAKGERNIPAVITQLEGAEAEAASLFENLIRKDLAPLEKARMVKKLVDFTKGGITAVSAKYGLPKKYCQRMVKYSYDSCIATEKNRERRDHLL